MPSLELQFLILRDQQFNTVPDLLRRMQAFEPIGGLVVNWQMFGSSGHMAPPQGGVLQVSPSSPLHFSMRSSIRILNMSGAPQKVSNSTPFQCEIIAARL